MSIQALEQKGSEGVQLHDKIHQLREHNTELMAQVASLEKKSSDVSLRAEELRVVNSQLESQVDTLQKESMVGAAAVAEEIQQLRAHNTQLGSQVEALQKQSAESVVVVEALQQQQTVGPTMEQVYIWYSIWYCKCSCTSVIDTCDTIVFWAVQGSIRIREHIQRHTHTHTCL